MICLENQFVALLEQIMVNIDVVDPTEKCMVHMSLWHSIIFTLCTFDELV